MKVLLSARVGITGVHQDSLSLTLEGGGCPGGDPWVNGLMVQGLVIERRWREG